MSIEEEMTLSEPTVTEPAAATPANFDLAAWMQGVTPARKTVRLYARGDLFGKLEAIQEQIELARKRENTEEVERLLSASKVIVDSLEASALDVVVEGRSSEFVQRFSKQLEAEGITDTAEQMKRLVVEQVVSPAGFTLEMLESLIEKMEPQVTALITAVQRANTLAPRVTSPF